VKDRIIKTDIRKKCSLIGNKLDSKSAFYLNQKRALNIGIAQNGKCEGNFVTEFYNYIIYLLMISMVATVVPFCD